MATVHFAQPFPPATPDLKVIPTYDWGHYRAASDTSRQLLIAADALVNVYLLQGHVERRERDSLARVQPDSLVRMVAKFNSLSGLKLTVAYTLFSYAMKDTLFSFRQPAQTHVRRYRGHYYFSQPAPDDSTAWEVRRLTLSKGHFAWEHFNPDSLRIRALAPTTVRLRRQARRLFFTLSPAPGAATRQVHDYAGLWLPEQR